MEKVDYKELGLTKNEGKVYEQLVRLGKLGSGDLSRESGVSYSKIYTILDSLINKGLVAVIPEKSKKFVPTNPETLMKLIEKKQENLENIKKKVKEMKQFYDVKEKNPILMGIGRKGFYKIIKQMKDTKHYDYSIKWTSETKPRWMGIAKNLIKEGKDLKTLTRYDEETKKDVDKWLKIKKEIRRINNEGVAMSIQDDDEVMISLIKSNVTLLIRDKPFTKIMKKMFIETYKIAEKIK